MKPILGRLVARLLTLLAVAIGSPGVGASPRLVAFHAPWDAASAASLATHGSELDVLVPAWVSVTGPDHAVTIADDPAGHNALAGLRRRPRLWIMVQNARLGAWDGIGAASLLRDRAATDTFLAKLMTLAAAEHAGGIVLDFENLPQDAQPALAAFLRRAHEQALGLNLPVAVTAPVADPSWNLAALGAAADRVILMAYDEHWQTGAPGPIASRTWFAAVVARALAALPRAKAIVAVASYGYDWTASEPASVVSVDQARALAARFGATVALDQASRNAHFRYVADGVEHDVWFAYATSVEEQLGIAVRAGAPAIAVWRLGTEDSALWSAVAHRRSARAISR